MRTAKPRIAMLLAGSLDSVLEHVVALSGPQFGLHPDDPVSFFGFERMPEGDVALVGSGWARKAAAGGADVAGDVIPRLRRSFDRVVGFDQEQSFRVGFASDVIEALDTVLRPHGVYMDPTLYAWDVGALTAAGRWTERTIPLAEPPTEAALARLQLSLPFFVTECPSVRALMRAHRVVSGHIGRLVGWSRGLMDVLLGYAPAMRPRSLPRRTAHFVGELTHTQRIGAVRSMRGSRLACDVGLTGCSLLVNGLGGDRRARLSRDEVAELMNGLRREGLIVPRRSRLRYRSDMLACKAVVSIAGHGEICFRMAEAMWMRRVLVTQDLSHVCTLFPFRAGANVVYCRPDLSNLVEILDDIECNPGRYLAIAEQGHADFLEFSANAPAAFVTVARQLMG